MSRPAKFTEDEILDAALRLAAEGGPSAATIGAISGATGAPVGSIYHRFSSRELLLARLWIRTVRRFQEGFLEALRDADPNSAALAAARYAVTWSIEHFDQARILALYRREDLAAQWSKELGDELAALNVQVEAALKLHADRLWPGDGEAVQRLVFALIDVPYAAVRRNLASGQPPPPIVAELVEDVCRFLLAQEHESRTT